MWKTTTISWSCHRRRFGVIPCKIQTDKPWLGLSLYKILEDTWIGKSGSSRGFLITGNHGRVIVGDHES